MDIKQTSQHLQRLGQPFDVIVVNNGIERQLYTNLEPTDVETLLEEIQETHSPERIIIQERQRNGSVNIKKEKYSVSLNGINASNMDNNQAIQPLNVPADFKDYMISDLKEKLNKSEKRVDKLETENEDLKKKNFELEKENTYKDKEFELDKKAQEFEKSNGLSGVLETVSTNPALATIAATAIGRLMGIDVPQMGLEGATGQEPTSGQENTDSVQSKVAQMIHQWIMSQSDEVAQKVYNLFTLIAADTDKVDDLINLLSE